MSPVFSDVAQLFWEKKYVFRTDPWYVNIVGYRTRSGRVNRFDDYLTVYYKGNGKRLYKTWPITTRPGETWLRKKYNPKGTAILVPGQYIESHRLALHKGKQALVQVKPVKVARDPDENGRWDLGPVEEGLFGIDVHRAGVFSQFVNSWSAGCQVFQREKDFLEFLGLLKYSMSIYGNSFTYTLVEI